MFECHCEHGLLDFELNNFRFVKNYPVAYLAYAIHIGCVIMGAIAWVIEAILHYFLTRTSE